MRVWRSALGLSLAATLWVPGLAWAQGASPPTGTSLDAAAPAVSEEEFEARITDLVEQMQPVRLGTTWAKVVDAALQRFDELTQAAAQVTDTAGTPPSREVLAAPAGAVVFQAPSPAGDIPEDGPTFQVGQLRVILKPVVASSQVTSTFRAPEAILLGVTVRAPWMVP
jgi:hypothetical protein